MMELSIDLTDGQVVPALLYTITRMDGTTEYVTNATRDIEIDGTIWTAMGGFQAGAMTQRNDGTPPTHGFNVTLSESGNLRFRSVDRGLYERADVLVQIVDAADPATPDFIFQGKMLGTISYDPQGQCTFDLMSKWAIPRDIFVKIFTLGCDHQFGDPKTCQVPVFPYILGGDMHDLPDIVQRSTAYAQGIRQRFRFVNNGTPEDYANVYLEALNGGTSAATLPAFSSTVGAVTADGSINWITRNAWARAVRIAATDGLRTLTMDRDPDPRATSDNSWYHPGQIRFITGEYAGRTFKGGNWNGAARTLQVYLPCPYVAVNDWAEIATHCDNTYTMCHEKYANTVNHGGNPFSLGAKAQAQQLGLEGL